MIIVVSYLFFFFFFNDTATTEIYTLSLHDALPISAQSHHGVRPLLGKYPPSGPIDRKSTRLNSSHGSISYAVFCLKTKKHTSEAQSREYLVCPCMRSKKAPMTSNY